MNVLNNINRDFMATILGQGFILIAAALCVGVATKDILFKFIEEVLTPLALTFQNINVIYKLQTYLKHKFKPYPSATLTFDLIFQTLAIFLKWSLVLFLTYVLFTKVIKVNYITTELSMLNKVSVIIQEQL